MKRVRVAYMVFVVLLAVAQIFVAFSPWTAPALIGPGNASLKIASLVTLFAAWTLAALVDVLLGLKKILPLSFAVEAVFCNLGLAVMTMLASGVAYFLCAVVPPAFILVKALEELTGFGKRPAAV